MIKFNTRILLMAGMILVLFATGTSIFANNPFNETSVSIKLSDSQSNASGGNQSPVNSVAANETSTKNSSEGMFSYTVKPGDYLSKICQQFYGASGMWTEILKYQLPSIISNPNLIFAGQIIVLPLEIAGKIGNSSAANSNVSVKSATSSSSSSSNSNSSSSSGGKFGSVSACQPAATRVTSSYGMRVHPITGKQKMHNGIDLAVPNGTRLNALGDGVVSAVGYESAGGNYVKVKYPNGYESIYCHLQKANVSIGQKVNAGQQIALSDNSGGSTGPHLHLGIKKNGTYVNPKSAGFPLP